MPSCPRLAIGLSTVGERTGPVLVDDTVLAELEALSPLAPLHQPHNIAGIRAAQKVKPHLQQVACFDTAFHQTLPTIARQLALPHPARSAPLRLPRAVL